MDKSIESFFTDSLPAADFRGKISATEKFMKALPQVHAEPVHRFAPGMYSRQLTMPADTIWMSKTHKHDHFAFIMSGCCTVVSPEGRETLYAPFFMKTKAGTKRLLLIHEECTWITVHAVPPEMDSVDDLEKIEEQLVCGTLEDYDNYLSEKKIRGVLL